MSFLSLLLLPAVLLIGLSCIAATILGWIAVSQIRRSNGQIRGLGLALFDGLLFPLLVLDGVIVGLGWFAAGQMVPDAFGDSVDADFRTNLFMVVWAGGATLVSVIADHLIIRRVWRAANKPPNGEANNREPAMPVTAKPGRSRKTKAGLISAAILAVVLAALFFWTQRPRLYDDRTISADSPNGMYSALGQTWYAKRIFGDDRTFYRFVVQEKDGPVLELYDQPFSTKRIAQYPKLMSQIDLRFSKHGHIIWSDDSKRVSFKLSKTELFAYNVDDGSHSFQAGYHPEKTIDLEYKKDRICFMDLDSGQVSFGATKTLQAYDMMRMEGLDIRKIGKEEDLTLLDGVCGIVAEKSGPNANPRAFDTIPTERVFETVKVYEDTLAQGPSSDPPLFGINPNNVYAVKTREGAIGLLEILKDAGPGRTRLRYKLVQGGSVSNEDARNRADAVPKSKRQRFDPKPGTAKDTSWTIMDKPSDLNPDGWAIMAHMRVGGVVPARLPGETNDFCRIKMTEGNDDQITLNIADLKRKSALTVTLNRDQRAEILVDGEGYRVTYPAIYVAADQPDTSPFALVIVTRSQSQGFGTVMERVIHDLDEEQGSEAVDLRTGLISSIPSDIIAGDRDAYETWFKTNQMNLLADYARNQWALMVKNLKLCQFSNRRWDELQPEEIREQLDADISNLEMLERGGHRYYLLGEGSKPPLLFAFQTDAGELGALEILAFTDNPRGVKVRYKLVQEVSASNSGSVEAVARAFMAALQDDNLAGATSMIATGAPLANMAAATLQRNAQSLRTAYEESPDRITQFTEIVTEGDWAAVRVAAPTMNPTRGLHLILHRTGGTWRIAGFDDASVNTPLKTYLDRASKNAVAPPRGSTAGAGPRAYPAGSAVVDAFLESCAASGVTNSQQMFAALGMETFIAAFGNGQEAMREHHDQLPPIMQAAILRTSGDPSPEFIDYVWKAHLEKGAAQETQALLLLNILGHSEGAPEHVAAAATETTTKNTFPKFAWGDCLAIWHVEQSPEPVTLFIMEGRIFTDPTPVMARLAALHKQKPFSAVPVRLGPPDWAAARGRDLVRDLEASCPAPIELEKPHTELPLAMDDGLYSTSVPVWNPDQPCILDFDDGSTAGLKKPANLGISNPEALRARQIAGCDAYVPSSVDMLVFPFAPRLLAAAPDNWQPEKNTANGLLQKVVAFKSSNREQSNTQEHPVAALSVYQKDGAWLLTDSGTLLLVRVEKDPNDSTGLKVIWRRVGQTANIRSRQY